MNDFELQETNKEEADKQLLLRRMFETIQNILKNKDLAGTLVKVEGKERNITFSRQQSENINSALSVIVHQTTRSGKDTVYSITSVEEKFKIDKIERDMSSIISKWERLLHEPVPMPPKGLTEHFDLQKAEKLKDEIEETIQFTKDSRVSAEMQKALGLNPISREELQGLMELIDEASKSTLP